MAEPEKPNAAPAPRWISYLAVASVVIPIVCVFAAWSLIKKNEPLYVLGFLQLVFFIGIVLSLYAVTFAIIDSIRRHAYGVNIILAIISIILIVIFYCYVYITYPECTCPGPTVLNNCRQLSNAADEYFLEHPNEKSVRSEMLLGSKLVTNFEILKGEKYTPVILTDAIVIATLPDGSAATYPEKDETTPPTTSPTSTAQPPATPPSPPMEKGK